MAATTVPASLRGYVSDFRYGDILDELVADLPVDLYWPNSVATYSSMRRESHINAGLNGYTLQLRRAQWQLDGRGCRPQVVNQVAEDMGLLVAGRDAGGAARVRGVSWHEHLRSALLSLTFGHQGFELGADTSSGSARLVTLAERPPHTIRQIYTDPRTGAFLGVDQTRAAKAKGPQIKADRMAWYCHEREAASWAGVSVLRSIWPAYVVKREMLKVHAQANRRWGMGIPVMEALPGTAPTPAQMSEAMQMASAARAGEQAGAASPPNFAMRILGITGSVPDTLGFLRFLNQEISSGLLMPHMDLGSSANGSRALGESFTDSWLLALGSIGAEICDVATRQIAARIVEWNFGPDEPVPSVVVSGIGAKRDVTAESLKLLLDAGALAADPALEAWVRREYRLPEREQAAPSAPIVPPTPAPEASARPRAKRRQAKGQLPLFNAADDPEPDHAAIQEQWEQAKADLLAQWPEAAQSMVDELAAQAEAAVEEEDLGLLGSLAVSAGVIAAVSLLIGDAGVGLAVEAAAGVVAEAAAQGVTVVAPDAPGANRVRQTADAIAAVVAAGYASGAARAALQIAGADPATVRAAVEAHLSELGTSTNGIVGDNMGALLSAAQNAGRLAVLEVAPDATYAAVEANDKNRCKACADVSGKTFATLAEAVESYPSAGFKDCAGGLRCRGFIFPTFP